MSDSISYSEDNYLPREAECRLHVRIDGRPAAMLDVGKVPWTTKQTWEELQSVSKPWYEHTCNFEISEADWKANFRNRKILQSGHFVICGEDKFKTIPKALVHEEQIRDNLFREILNYFVAFTPNSFTIEVFWDFYRPHTIHQHLAESDFLVSVQQALYDQLQHNFEDREYFPRERVNRVLSREVVERLINNNSKIREDEKRDFLKKIFPKSVILLAICVWSRISLSTLKRVLDCNDDISDFASWLILEVTGSPLLGNDRISFKDHLPRFFHHRFETLKAVIASDGSKDVKLLTNREVVPVHYHGRERRILGSGVFSDVFEVRIDPSGHQFSAVHLPNLSS